MVFLGSLTLRGYKSIADLNEFEFRPLNVLIGANGAGKSNFLSFFELLRAVIEGRLATYVASQGGASSILHYGAKRTPVLSFDLDFREKSNGYKLELTATPQGGLAPTEEEVRFWDRSQSPMPFSERLVPEPTEAAIRHPFQPGAAWWVHREVALLQRYHFHDTGPTSPLRGTVDVNDNEGLRSDGSNLAAFLYLLKTNHVLEFDQLQRHLIRVAPFIRELVVEPLALSPGKTRLRWRHVDDDALFDVAALSDGTLRFLALVTVLLQPARLPFTPPQLVIIDEPELGLHPFAIKILGAMIRSASAQRQLLVATQSPLLLDEFSPEDIIVTELEDGASKFRRLSTAALHEWLEEFSMGELWEKNELGGRPG